MLCSQNFYPGLAWIFLTDFNQAVLHGKASWDSGEVWGERKRGWAYQTGPSKKFLKDELKELNIEQLWYLWNCQKSFKNNRLSQVAEVFLHLHQQHRTTWTQVLRHSCVKGGVAQSISCSTIKAKKSQELRMLSRSLSDCQSQTLNVMVRVTQFIRNSKLCH